MEKRKFKKGFTLVELIVVIAIIAILAAVSVVSYLAFIRQANESADIQLVKQLNTSLQGDEVLNNKRSTMHEMLGAMEENGFVVENLTKTKSGYDIVWDQTNNRFALLDGEKLVYGEESYKNAKTYNVWKFADNVSEAEKKHYSIYLTNDFIKTNATSLTVYAGLDVGDYAGLSQINYENNGTNPVEQKVTIRTNGGSLTVKAPNDTIKHYGNAQVVTLTAVSPYSYFECGSVNLVDIKKGRLVITNNAEAEVGTIYLSSTNNAYDGIILATQSGATLPNAVTREAVTNPTTGEKLVVTIQTNVDGNGENPTKTEEIKLYPESDVKEGTNGYNVSDLGLLVVEANSNEAKEEAAAAITDEEALARVKESKVASPVTTINDFEELVSYIGKVNSGELINPVLYFPNYTYQFTHEIELNKSVSLLGVYNKTTFLGYFNPKQNKTSDAFCIKTSDENQSFSFDNINFKDFGLYKSQGVYVASNKACYSGISESNDSVESTKINVLNCNFEGLNCIFLNLKAGTHTIKNCVFDGTKQSYTNPNEVQVGDSDGVKKSSVIIDNCQFISAKQESGALFDATGICPWGLTNLTVTNCDFIECSTCINGGSEWFDYGSEYPAVNYSNCTFTDCILSLQLQYWVTSESEIPARFTSYVEAGEDETTPGNYYYDGSGDSVHGYSNYRVFYTYNGGDNYSDFYIFWFK